MYIQTYMRTRQTQVLGPGNRYALWVQGCPFRCDGCLAPNSLSKEDGEQISIVDLANDILNQLPDIEGVTISGGEPFMQAGPLSRLVDMIRHFDNLGVIVYSGFTQEQLLKGISNNKVDWAKFYNQIDLLID